MEPLSSRQLQVITPDASYCVFNSISSLKKLMEQYSRVHVLCDHNTETLARDFFHHFQSEQFSSVVPGEDSKSIKTLEILCEKLVKILDRKSLLICFGGGVIGDLGGFLGSILFRGIDTFQIPTSLLAMVDSSIGGKTAVNLTSGKNLIGAFKSPVGVFIHSQFLSTLPEEQWYSGWGEVFKSAALDSKIMFEKALSVYKRQNWKNFKQDMEDIIFESIQLKQKYVEQDYFEKAQRKLLNLGHTIGHALESFYNYEIPHGTCVLEGMYFEAKLGVNLGLTDSSYLSKIEELYQNSPIKKFNGSFQQLLPWMKVDKKNLDGKITFAMLKDFGVPAVEPDGCIQLDEYTLLSKEP